MLDRIGNCFNAEENDPNYGRCETGRRLIG